MKKLLTIILLSLLMGCHVFDSQNGNKVIAVQLPSLTENIDLEKMLTYSAFVVLNDTSAHLFTLGNDLIIKGELVSRYETNDDRTTYRLYLDPTYQSYRGEQITNQDVLYSIEYLAGHSEFFLSTFQAIRGLNGCRKDLCKLDVSLIHDNGLEIKLVTPDPNFINRLATPFLIIFKAKKSYYESIGNCVIPYQTGRGLLTSCVDGTQEITFRNGKVVLYVEPSEDMDKMTSRGKILVDNTGQPPFPSLIVLSLYAVPGSKISPVTRTKIMNRIMSQREQLADLVKLKPSYTVVSPWFKLNEYVFPGINVFKRTPDAPTCPARPIRIMMETTMPSIPLLQDWIRSALPCPIEFIVDRADKYFNDFYSSDFGFMWVTTDILDYYEIYAIFDCANPPCYIDWHDRELLDLIGKLKNTEISQVRKEALARRIEQHLMSHGYVAPLLQMNSWIKVNNSIKPIHPAGLAQLKASDFLHD